MSEKNVSQTATEMLLGIVTSSTPEEVTLSRTFYATPAQLHVVVR